MCCARESDYSVSSRLISCCCAKPSPVPWFPLRSSCSLSSREDLEACGFRVQVGQLRLYDHDKLTKVTQIICHPKFNPSLSAEGGADIALLKLEAPVTLSEHVNLVTLPPASLTVPERTMCWVTGWGYLRLGGKVQGHLLGYVEMQGGPLDEWLWLC